MSRGRIFYFCYDHDRATGGQKHTYQHVDILNKYGYEAYIFHRQKDFRLAWFENETRVLDREKVKAMHDRERDFIVLPEDLGERILVYPGKKVVFNKNLYCGFQVFGTERPAVDPYHHPEIVGVFAVSDHNAQHLQFAYPHLKVLKVIAGIDSNVFRYRALPRKERRIACIPKASAQGLLLTVYHMLQARAERGLNRLKEYEWTFFEGYSERQIADVLRKSLIFIFTSAEEGLGRMPLEAMLSGCLVAGLDSGPPKEYLPSRCRFEPGNMIEMVKYIEDITNSFPEAINEWTALSDEGRRNALVYSLQEQEHSVVSAWEEILSSGSLNASGALARDSDQLVAKV
jgi:Glycosyl transferases group 1